jgi:non-ribosomal peptide synthetase component F
MGEGGQGGEAPRLDAAAWRLLKERAGRRAVTPAGLVLTAFCDVLAAWSESPRFAVAVAGAGLVEVDAAAPGTFEERARLVQERLWQSSLPVPPAWPITFHFPPLPGAGSAVGEGGQGGEGLHAEESQNTLTLRWSGAIPIPALLPALHGHLRRLAAPGSEAAWSDERRRLIPPQQLARRMHAGAPGAPLPRERLEALVAARAEEAPERAAVVAPGRTLSYGELAARARRLGAHLRGLGAGPGMLVAVVAAPGWEATAAILGVLAAGAAWVPVPPGLPPELFRERLDDHLAAAPGRPALAVTTREAAGLAWSETVHRVVLDAVTDDAAEPFRTPPSASDLACILPLPGSGGPMLEHRGIANLALDVGRTFGIGADDRLLATAPLDSPLALFEIFGPLLAGATLVLPGADPLATARREGATVWITEPEPLVRTLDSEPGPLPFRLVLASGRSLPAGLAERLRAACPGARLGRLTPVVEAPLWSAIADLDAPASFYGRPLANLTLHVLDDRLEPRPDGVAGALWLGGAGLARGAWRAPLATEARFTVHPDTGERLFRTGETARVRADGAVEIEPSSPATL